MSFGASFHLAQLYSPAPPGAVKEGVRKLLEILGESDPGTIEELSAQPVTLATFQELSMWINRFATFSRPDSTGQAATRFWAAQTLVTTVMRATILDQDVSFSPSVKRAMERGAEGLFEVGRSQFLTLARTAKGLLKHARDAGISRLVAIESPLGNSVPIQLLAELARRTGANLETTIWSAPRNDRAKWGRTIADAAKELAASIPSDATVIFMDDALTGTRFIKLFDELEHQFKERVIPVALMFNDVRVDSPQTRDRLMKRLRNQGRTVGYEHTAVTFPPRKLFTLDDHGPVLWTCPVMWGDSDLIAGKRKVNLIFTILDHVIDILADLAADDSIYRAHLEEAWHRNQDGETFLFAPGLLQSLFITINEKLNLDKFNTTLQELARNKFSDDYIGKTLSLDDDGVRERWEWLRSTFLEIATTKIGNPQEAYSAWRAIDNTFAATGLSYPPRASRDHAAAPCIFNFNATVLAFNRHLIDLIIQQSDDQDGDEPTS
jgi:hypothetical protein